MIINIVTRRSINIWLHIHTIHSILVLVLHFNKYSVWSLTTCFILCVKPVMDLHFRLQITFYLTYYFFSSRYKPRSVDSAPITIQRPMRIASSCDSLRSQLYVASGHRSQFNDFLHTSVPTSVSTPALCVSCLRPNPAHQLYNNTQSTHLS